MTSCKSFSGRAAELITDIQAVIDPSIAKSSKIIRTAAVDEEDEFSDDHADGGNEEDVFFDQTELSDHNVDDDGWESGSVHSENDDPSAGQLTTSINSDSEPELQSCSTLDAALGRSTDPDSDSDASNLSLHVRKRAPKPSVRVGSSTFLPSLSVGYIPGTGDSDPEDEFEALEGKTERKNRRGQRARRA